MKPCRHDRYVFNCQWCELALQKPELAKKWNNVTARPTTSPKGCTDCKEKRRIKVGLREKPTVAPPVDGQTLVINPGGRHGIGDVCLASTVVCALADQFPRSEIYLHVGSDKKQWLDLFAERWQVTTTNVKAEWTCDPMASYDTELIEQGKLERQQYYMTWCGGSGIPRLPRLKELTETEWAKKYAGSVLVFTQSHWANRAPTKPWYFSFVSACKDAGLRVVTVGHDSQCQQYGTEYLRNESAAKIAAAMAVCKCVISPDTAGAHLGGIYRAPRTIALLGPTKPGVFAIYPTVDCMTGSLGCEGCYWRGAKWDKRCDTVCSSLVSIQPGDLVKKLLN